jgi:hypothetical protein
MTDEQRDSQQPQRYELKVRGHLGETMLLALPALAVETQGADTLLTLPDQAALYGVLAQIEVAGLELLEVRRVRK